MEDKKKNKAKKQGNVPAVRDFGDVRKNSKNADKSSKNNAKNNTRPAKSVNLTPYFLIVFAVFMLLSLASYDMFDQKDLFGVVGSGIRNLSCGLFGVTAYAIPFLLIYLGVRWRKFMIGGDITAKTFVSILTVIDLGVIVHVFAVRANGAPYGIFKLGALYSAGKQLTGGGMIGGFFGECAYKFLNVWGSAIICIAVLVVFVIFLIGISPAEAWSGICSYVNYLKARSDARRAEAIDSAIEAEEKKAEKKARDAEKTEQRLKADAEKQRERAEQKRNKENAKPARFTKVEKSEIEQNTEYVLTDEDRLDLMFDQDEARRIREESIAKKRREAAERRKNEGDEKNIIEKFKDASPVFTPDDLNKTDADNNTVNADTKSDKKSNETDISPESQTPENIDPITSNPTSDDENNVEEVFKTVFVSPENKEDADPDEKLEVRTVSLKKIENDEKVADGVCLGDDDSELESEEETREERQERMSKLDARGNELIEYTFPPYNLLKVESESSEAEAEAELRANADILMQTFEDFKVGIKEISYSRGPTITRYELLPKSGTRIRTIAGLVDDIALALAAPGIRMEAPIPGKSLVGIEVPNKVRANVYARQLLDSDTFRNAESRLFTCLGKDVAGSPVFFDISKMPHLLIAGATGMGKSVCINTIIVSLLYKARPDEVKLMLIDPKKVEFGVYNGIPHLLVPVVTDPKKSAGTLQWAVNEMERRFELIESVNVRDIKAYNAITAGDPEKEFMPHIVIIIDELADLMMTAAGDVENSICRLAQKARAAGIHLIIGTQRPSVDVITGLIKSNIPSRIAFTVASQIDSRTILDTIGADKLIGKGDMLFNPVGAMKPIRVQGAFITEDEVINITNFIKANSSAVKYDDGVISSIEEAAALCGVKKGSKEAEAAADALITDSDPLFRRALEEAVNSGSMATSALQRSISVGYGRAARIIDRMEKLHFVSPPNGNKPREVLLTREQFDRMVLENDPRVDGLLK